MNTSKDQLYPRNAAGSAARVCVSLCLLLTACGEQAEADGYDGAVFRGETSTDFARRVSDMAWVADVAYEDGTGQQSPILHLVKDDGSTIEHVHRAGLSTDAIQVWEGDDFDGPTSIIVAFRGTQASPFKPIKPICGIGDIFRDIEGSLIQEGDLHNPWASELGVEGHVGRGFNTRVRNYMESNQGQGLLLRLDELIHEGETFEIHIVGHSLGAIASQIFSLYVAQYMEHLRPDASQYKIFNFAYNAPRAVDLRYSESYIRAIQDDPAFYGFNFTVKGDPVSTLGLSWWEGSINAPNSLSTKFSFEYQGEQRTADIGYCAHGQLDSVGWNMFNHDLNDKVYSWWANPGSFAGEDTWPQDVAECMAGGYSPSVLTAGSFTRL